jgi:DNA topoisomerase I
MAIQEVDCHGPGIRRRGAGRGFFYLDEDGSRIDDREVLARIRSLAIPPAWTDVWICSDPVGHIQATGVDAKGRRQYRYHDEWHEERSREKHERILRFARKLPGLRERVDQDLQLGGMPKERVLACAVRLLEMGFFRVGGESYAEENGSYGLATLQKRHISIRGGRVHFDYDAKSGQHRRCQVVDPDVLPVLMSLRRRRSAPESELLAYKDGRRWVDIKSQDINAYIQETLGQEFSAKDFRTWVGTVLAALAFSDQDPPENETQAKRAVAQVAKTVAQHLGNTPAVARSAYIDPRVVEAFQAEDTLEDLDQVEELEEVEAEVIKLVRRADRKQAAG